MLRVRTPRRLSDATDPVDSRMIRGRSMPSTMYSARPMMIHAVEDAFDVEAVGDAVEVDAA